MRGRGSGRIEDMNRAPTGQQHTDTQNEQQHATHPEPDEHSEHNSDNGAHDGGSAPSSVDT